MTHMEKCKALRADTTVHYNCAQAVLVPFAAEMGITEEQAYKMGAHFGSGMRHGSTCGAITGAVLALGLVKGRRNPFGPKEEMGARVKQLQGEIYPVFGQMIEEIKAHFGTLICSEMSQQFDDFDGKPRKKNCMEAIAYCAAIAVKYAEI